MMDMLRFKFSSIFFGFFVIFNLQSNAHGVLFFSEEARQHGKEWAESDALFSPVGRVFIEDSEGMASGSGTVFKNDRVLTAAHVIRGARRVFFSFTGRIEDSIPVSGYVKKEDVDLAVLKLEHPVSLDGVTLPLIAKVDPKKFSQMIWDSIPSAPGLPFTREFALAGFGRVRSLSPLSVEMPSGVKHAGMTFLNSSPTRLRRDEATGNAVVRSSLYLGVGAQSEAGASMFTTCSISQDFPACSRGGDSGGPLFTRNLSGKKQWQLVGVLTNSDASGTGSLVSILTPDLENLLFTESFEQF